MKKGLLLLELASVLALLVSGLLPGLDTYVVLLVGWFSLWRRGLGWRDVGLKRSPHLTRHLLTGVLIGLLWAPLDIFLVEPLVARMTGQPLDLSQLKPLVGNVTNYGVMLLVVWCVVAVGEEMTYRGYLLNRCADLLGRGPVGLAVSLALVSLVFALAHSYQGLTGIITTGYVGFGFGIIYLAAGRNLWCPIITHATYDTVGLTLIFLNRYPALS